MARQAGWPALFWAAFTGSRNAMVLLDERRHQVEVNDAYVELLGYPRGELLGRPVYELVEGGPLLTAEEWRATIARGEFSGETDLVCADGSTVTVQYAGHTEVVTGERRVLFVALSTSRWGRQPRYDADRTTPTATLSPREREIVHLVAAGETGPEIAEHLHISDATARTHVRNAMTKLGARSRAHLVAKALGEGHSLG
jgi:PAS domain S-box-containing protein